MILFSQVAHINIFPVVELKVKQFFSTRERLLSYFVKMICESYFWDLPASIANTDSKIIYIYLIEIRNRGYM